MQRRDRPRPGIVTGHDFSHALLRPARPNLGRYMRMPGRTEIPANLRFRFTIAFLFLFLPALAPAQIRTIYVIPSSHWDRGFIASPKTVTGLVKPHIDEVIDDAAADPRFRWTIESIWQLNSWLERTNDPTRLALLQKLVQRGQIEVSGVYGSMHMEFMGAEELNLVTQDGFRLARRLGISIPDFAMMDDVPGFTRWLPQVLAGSRIRYFLNGSNLFIRGGTSLAPGHVPFYWQAPDGSKVLTWISEGKNGGYTEGMSDYYLAPGTRNPYPPHGLLIPKRLWGRPPLEVMQIGIKKLLGKYEQAGYRYDAVLVMYMHDFISPAAEENDLLPAVQEWNAAGRTPAIRVAVPKEFFDHIVAKYDDQIPTYRGDWTGLWAEVKTNSPRISAIAREDQMELTTNGLLLGSLATARRFRIPIWKSSSRRSQTMEL
jgi:Glycosyl hydrolases family 38 N-terminal domain